MVGNAFSTNRGGFRRRGDGRSDEFRSDNPPGDRGAVPDADGPPPPRRGGRPPFGRPPWMTEEEHKALIEKRGVHSFVIGLSTGSMASANAKDLWMRLVIGLLATAAAGVSAFAWRNLARSAELQIRLVKAGEMNAHLKEMNLAAAGLAHETRNPLNLIRGLAQLISREETAPADVRDRSKAIVDEADRVTAQLNEFINYSRPREVRRASVSFNKVGVEVARALKPDAEDKQIEIRVSGGDFQIEADNQLLRQVLFNLMLNAIQAVPEGGRIEVALVREEGTDRARLEVRDDGPGVPPELRAEIFKPYVTMHQNGTGLGLAIVHQIVSAHGWDIECTANEPQGAAFVIRHVKLANGRK
jgi:signal transduction histidine kinase